jgi:hypothetical protein
MASEPTPIPNRGPRPPIEEKPKSPPKDPVAPKTALAIAKGQHPPQEE